MNRFFFFLLAFMVTSAMNAEQVTKQAALQKAKQFMPGKNFTVAKSRSLSRGVDPQTEEADFYILNADGGGYVVVSGDDRTREILGYSEQGNLDLEKAPANLRWWLDEYARQIEAIKSLPQRTTRTTSSLPNSWPAISPLLSAKWGQDGPFNYMCPDANGKDFDEEGYDSNNRCVTGCVATALAQVMYYWKWPNDCPALDGYPVGYYKNGEFVETMRVKGLPSTTFKWTKMKDEYTNNETGEAADAVAELMRYCCQVVKMDYGTDESGSYIRDEYLPRIGYSKNTRTAGRNSFTAIQWESLIYEELAAGRPVTYNGSSKYIGHEFVVDGYDGNGLFHMNFGWGGDYNDYYALTLYETDQLDESPYLEKGEHIGFVFNQGAIIDLKPCDPDEVVLPNITSNLGSFLTKEYTRTSNSADFTNVILPFDLTAQYSALPESDIDIEVGWGLYKDNQFIKCIGYEESNIPIPLLTERELTGFALLWRENMTADFGADIEPGKYQLYQIYRFHENEAWARSSGFGNSLIADITSTTMTLRLTDKYGKNFTVNSFTHSDPSVDNPITVKVNVTNNGDWNLLLLNLWVQKQGTDSWINVAQGSSKYIFRDDSGDIEMSFTLQEPGTYNLKITSCSSDEALKTATMTVEANVDVVIDHVKYRCSPAYGTAIVVENEGNYGNGEISSITILPTVPANGVECKVKAIDEKALEWIPQVHELVIPEGVESIGYCAFSGWHHLEHLTIPSTVKKIGQYAFGNNDLKTVVSYMTDPPSIYQDVFMTCDWDPITHSGSDYSVFPSATLYVPAGCAKKYGDAYTWKLFTNIVEMPSTVKGDADGDGDVTLKDVELVKEYIMTGKTEGLIFTNADINGDEKLNVIDIVYILNIIKN